MKKIYAILLFLCTTYTAFAQLQYATLLGKVTDESNQTIIGATVVLKQGSAIVKGAQTDFDGNYIIKNIAPGKYDVEIKALGKQSKLYTDRQFFGDKYEQIDAKLLTQTTILIGVDVVANRIARIDVDNTQTGGKFTSDQIKAAATKDINSVAALAGPGISQKDNGSGINIAGARDYNATYIIDGMHIRGTSSGIGIPYEALEDVTVVTGGLSAKYGDLTSGAIIANTKTTGNQLHGSAGWLTSSFLDPYGYNQGLLTLTGPLISKKDTLKGANGKYLRKKVIGFFLAATFERHLDKNPNFIGTYTAKPDILNRIQQNPLTPAKTGNGLDYSANYLTYDSLNHNKIWQNNSQDNYQLSFKVDYALAKNIFVVAGGAVDYRSYDNTGLSLQLLDPSAGISHTNYGNYRGYARFQQYFEATGKDKESAVIQNASYEIQADYTKQYVQSRNTTFGNDIFKYGYIGKFDTKRQPLYVYGTDSLTGFSGHRLIAYTATHVDADFSHTANPILANYTKEYYNYFAYSPIYTANIQTIQGGKGLVNGDEPLSIYSLFNNVGVQSGSYSNQNNDQYHLSFDANIDLKNPHTIKKKANEGNLRERGRHSIQFGFSYEQRIDRTYALAPVTLWTLMRQLTNQHLQTLDFSHPHISAGGDTIRYSRLIKRQDQATFDKNLRKAIGASDSTYVNIDAVDPNILKLSMFSPDELFNNGSSYKAFYFGYDYLGNSINGKQPSFNDFFTATDANGMKTRPMGAYRPIYTAGYIEDKFRFNDLLFDIGVRVDRFDANQNVLADPYSLYPERTVAEVNNGTANLGTIPSSVPSTAVVYVDDPFKPTKITGFRQGDQWYSASGTTIDNPRLIANPNTGTVTPYLKVANSSKLVVDQNSFSTYKPQTTVMPRISFSFPISDKSNFFAHYDVLTQRPNGSDGGIVSGLVNVTTPFEYFYLQQLTTDHRIANPNLQPERTIDYQVGFQQQLTLNSNVTISGLYRELRNQIQVTRIRYAYPVEYNTYGNTDFGTVKSLLVQYIYAAPKIVTFNVNYTLGFADGTGSSVSSFLGAFTANPDVVTPKPVLPFSYDQRHTISTSVDIRFRNGKDRNGRDMYDGPKALKWLLAATGINLNLNAATGTPYTQVTTAYSLIDSRTRVIKGTVNGSRLPFNYRLNLRADHTFSLKVNDRKSLNFNLYLVVLNLLNTKNILSVYEFTGSPSDDGYLSSANGVNTTKNQVSSASYNTLYQIYENTPSHYSQPRQVQLGLEFSF